MAKLQQLQSKLIEAQEDLQETEYDRYIQDQEDMLDKLYEEYEELITKKLDDFYSLVKDALDIANDNTGKISSYLGDIASENGYTAQFENVITATEGIKNSVDNVVSGIKNIETKLSNQFNGTETEGADGSKNEDGKDSTPTFGTSGGNNPGTNNANGGTTNKTITASTQSVYGAIAKLTEVNGVSATKIKNFIKKNAKASKKSRDKYNDVNKLLYDHLNKKVLSDTKLKELATMLSLPKKYTEKSQLYKALSGIKGIGFSEGGIGELIKATGEDGIALVRNGEGFVKPEDVDAIKKLLDTVPVMYDVMDSFKTIPTLPKTVPLASMGDVSFNFNIEGVQNANDLVKAIQTDNKVQKAIQSVSIDRVMGGGKLTVNQIIR